MFQKSLNSIKRRKRVMKEAMAKHNKTENGQSSKP